MIKRILFILVLICLVMVIPVSATYTQVASHTWGTSYATDTWQPYQMVMSSNVTGLSDVTKLELTANHCAGTASGSYAGALWNGSSKPIGTYSLSWSGNVFTYLTSFDAGLTNALVNGHVYFNGSTAVLPSCYGSADTYQTGQLGHFNGVAGSGISYTGTAVTTPVSSFTCSPLSQYPDEVVSCIDSSTNTPASWLWTLDYPALGITGWQTSTSQNFNWSSAYAGVFSVNLRATNSAGSDWENKTNYVEISATANPNGTSSYNTTNILLTVKDGLNSTALQNVYVELHRNDEFNSINSGYTDSNGQITFSGFPVLPDMEFRLWKAGYQYSNKVFTPSSYSYATTMYMYPNIAEPEIPETIDVTIRTINEVGLSAVSGATVYIENIATGDNAGSAVTNASGYVVFHDVPNTGFIGGHITKSGFVNEIWSLPYNLVTQSFIQDDDITYILALTPTASVTPTGTIVTPTPTPVSYDTLTLTASPDSIALGGTVTLTGSSSNATKLTYAGGLRRTSFYVNKHYATYPVDFQMIGQYENVNATYWKFRPNLSSSWETASTASPLTMTNIPDSNGLYTYSFNAYDSAFKALAPAATDIVNVGGGSGGGSLTIKTGGYDVTTGNRLMDVQLNITDDVNGVVTEYGTVNYDLEITLPRGNSYTLRGSKAGYLSDGSTSGYRQFTVPVNPIVTDGSFAAIFNVPFFPEGSVTVGNTTVSARVYDVETYYPLSNVRLVNSYAPTDVKYTEDYSAISWVLPQNTAYSITASKDGYCSVTESRNTSTNSYQLVTLRMKYGSCGGGTPTPTPTPTPTATVTPIGGWGNVTGEAIVCGDLPEDATFIDILKNSLACNGLEDTQSQNLGIACLIILFCAIVLGRVAKGVGVLAGVIAGTVLSTVAGFIPFWIIIVVIIIAGLVFAGKVFWSSGQ